MPVPTDQEEKDRRMFGRFMNTLYRFGIPTKSFNGVKWERIFSMYGRVYVREATRNETK